ncbi:hypothetical protein C0581_02965 [Candidatus Parcubacteria bacterium]|nr:MAG: hypothetical protein C0581_02965 [Candidatus Parcubacteria bacterium]
MNILLVTRHDKDNYKVKKIYRSHKSDNVFFFLPKQGEYNAEKWKYIDHQSRKLADDWGKKLLDDDMPFSRFLSLPVFFALRENLKLADDVCEYIGQHKIDKLILLDVDVDVDFVNVERHVSFSLKMSRLAQIIKSIFFAGTHFIVLYVRGLFFTGRSIGQLKKTRYLFFLSKAKGGAILKSLLPVFADMDAKTLATLGNQNVKGFKDMFPNERVISFLTHVKRLSCARFIRRLARATNFILFQEFSERIVSSGGDVKVSLHDIKLVYLKHIVYFAALENVFEKMPVGVRVLVVGTEVHPVEKFLCYMARKKDIQTVVMQHGITADLETVHAANLPSSVDSVLVWGQCSKDYFLNDGVESEKIHVCGSPQFDKYLVEKKYNNKVFLKKYSLPDTHIILFSGQNFVRSKNETLCRTVLKAYKKLSKTHKDNIHLVISPHIARSPYTSIEFYEHLIRQEGLDDTSSVSVVKTSDIHEMLSLCSCLVTSTSTLHVEAACMGKSVVILNVDVVEDVDMVKIGAAIGAHDEHELYAALQSNVEGVGLQEKHSNLFLEKYINYPQPSLESITTFLKTL